METPVKKKKKIVTGRRSLNKDKLKQNNGLVDKDI